MFSLHRYVGDLDTAQPTITPFNSLAELLADVQATEGLTQDEFYEFMMLRHFTRPNRAIIIAEQS